MSERLLSPAERSAKETQTRTEGQAIEARAIQLESEVSDLLKQQQAVPMTGQIQQGTKQEQYGIANWSHNHRPVILLRHVPNYVPYYSAEEQQKITDINNQIQAKQQQLQQLNRNVQPVPAPTFLQPDTRYSGGNVSVNYEGTLAARQAGFDVGSGLTLNLPETFQKEEDKRLYQMNKDRLPVVSATPYNPFKPVESGGLFDINTKAPKVAGYSPETKRGYNPITKTVTPQNPRKTIQREQPNINYSSYDPLGIDAGLAPESKVGASIKSAVSPIAYTPLKGTNVTARNYNALKNQPATTENLLGVQKQVLPSSLPTSSAFLSIPGISQEPQRPPQLTQVQVDALTSEQVAQYNANVKTYNNYYKQKRIEYIGSVKNLIDTAKAQGRTELVINTNGRTKTIPISSAYREFIAAETKDPNTTISAPTLINLSESLDLSSPKFGQTEISQTGKGKVSTSLSGIPETTKPIFVLGQPFIPLSRKGDMLTGIANGKDLVSVDFAQQGFQTPMQTSPGQERVDTISRGIEEASKRAAKNPIGQVLGEAGKDIYTIYPAGINLLEQYVFTPLKNQAKQQSTIPPKPLYVPETLSGIGTGTLASAGIEAGKSVLSPIKPIDLTKSTDELGGGYERLTKYVGEYGPGSVIGAGIAILAPTPAGGKLSPLKLEKFAIETEGGLKTISRGLRVGYGKVSAPLINIIERKPVLGSPAKAIKPSMLEELSPAGRGLEIATEGRYSRDILTSEKGLSTLEQTGKIQAGSRQIIKDIERATQILQLSERKVKDRVQSDFYPKTPSTAILPGKESKVLVEEILPKLPPSKGATILKTQIDPALQPMGGGITTADIDVDFASLTFGTTRANRAAENAVQSLKEIAERNRVFTRQGTKAYAETQGQPKEKFLELLTKKDVTPGAGYAKDFTKIFGIPLGKKVVKVATEGGKKVKQITLESQLKRQIASVVSIQGPRTEKFEGVGTPDYLKPGKSLTESSTGFRVGPPEARIKDLARLPLGFEQVSRNLEKKGYVKEATELREISARIKLQFPEVEFIDVFKGREGLELAGDLGSIPSRIGSSVSSAVRSTYPAIPIQTIKGSQTRPKQKQSFSIYPKDQAASITRQISKASRVNVSRIGSVASLGSVSRTNIRESKPSIPRPRSRSTISSIASAVRPSMPSSIRSPIKSPSSIASQIRGSTAYPASPGKGSPATPSPGISPPSKTPPYKVPPVFPPKFPPPVYPPPIDVKLPRFELKTKLVRVEGRPKMRKTRLFYTNPSDPLRAGVILAQGVPELRSRSPKIFRQVDVLLAKSRKRNRYAGLDQPYAGFNTKLLRF